MSALETVNSLTLYSFGVLGPQDHRAYKGSASWGEHFRNFWAGMIKVHPGTWSPSRWRIATGRS